MQQGTNSFAEMPESADALLARAIERDIMERLEPAMFDDGVVAAFLEENGATVMLDVVIDRQLTAGELSFRGERRDDRPFAGTIGQPAVVAIVGAIRRRIGLREIQHRSMQEPFYFEIAVHPDEVTPLGA